jgi:hypothetical protein
VIIKTSITPGDTSEGAAPLTTFASSHKNVMSHTAYMPRLMIGLRMLRKNSLAIPKVRIATIVGLQGSENNSWKYENGGGAVRMAS